MRSAALEAAISSRQPCLGDGHGLFQQQVFTGLEALHADGVVQVVRQHQEHGVHLVEYFAKICGHAHPLHLIGHGLSPLFDDIHRSA